MYVDEYDVRDLAAMVGGVHVAAFGFTDIDHVLNPLRFHQANAFILLENHKDAAYQRHVEEGQDPYEELDALGIPWGKRKCNLWDPTSVAGELREIQEELAPQEIYVNASTGPNTVAIGATIASLYWPIKLYHNGGYKPVKPMRSVHDTHWLPTIKAKPLDDRALDVLQVLKDIGPTATGRATKKRIREQYAQHFQSEAGGDLKPAALNNRLNATLHYLQEAGAVQKTGTNRSIKITITDDGKRLLQIHRPEETTRQVGLPRR